MRFKPKLNTCCLKIQVHKIMELMVFFAFPRGVIGVSVLWLGHPGRGSPEALIRCWFYGSV